MISIEVKKSKHNTAANKAIHEAVAKMIESAQSEQYGNYWYSWGGPHYTGSASANSNFFSDVGWVPYEPIEDAYPTAPVIKLQSRPVVKVLPSLDGAYARITVSIAFADNFMDGFSGCTGNAADAIVDSIRREILRQLIEWNKSVHEGGVWPNQAEAVDSSPT